MFCGNCGKEISGENGVCEYCGAPCKEGGNTQKKEKSETALGALHFQGKKKILAVGAAALCVIAAALMITVPRLLGSPKQKVLMGAAKTVKAGIMGDTTLVGVLGLDEMAEEIRKGGTVQVLELTCPEEGLGIRSRVFSDQKKGLSRWEISPTISNMDLTELIAYKQENLLYFGLPDVLGDVYYVDLANLREECSGSAVDLLVQEKTGRNLSDILPEDLTGKEDHSYLIYCREELSSLYDDMEVEKDGTETVRIDGKSQKCSRYHVTISGSSIKDLLSVSLDYLEEKQGLYTFMAERMLYAPDAVSRLKQDVLPLLRLRDLDMTVCLDKKGRLVSCKGKWTIVGGGEQLEVEYDGTFTGGVSPMDRIRGTLLLSLSDEEYEFTFERDKQYQKKSGLKDQMDLTIVNTYGSYTYIYPYSYEFSYNPGNGKWDFTLANTDSGYQMEGTGRISDGKKGKELSVTIDEFIDVWDNYYEGTYELTSLGKEGVESLEGIENGISLFDMGRPELKGVSEDLKDWASSLDGAAETSR